MDKILVFGELLYIGLVAEKGRCKSKGIWNLGYGTSLYNHMIMLFKLCTSIQKEGISNEDLMVLNEFIKFLETKTEFKEFYPIKPSILREIIVRDFKVFESSNGRSNASINILMFSIIKDILNLLSKGIFVDKRKVSMLLRASHNLPRYYLGENNKTLCELSLPSIEYEDAIEYTFQNMDDEARQKYKSFI